MLYVHAWRFCVTALMKYLDLSNYRYRNVHGCFNDTGWNGTDVSPHSCTHLRRSMLSAVKLIIADVSFRFATPSGMPELCPENLGG